MSNILLIPIHPPGSEDQSGKSMVIPCQQGQSPPFRYLGRSMELSASRPND
jgi:hypothetical protein